MVKSEGERLYCKRVNGPGSNEKLVELVSAIPDPEVPVITISELGILRSVEMVGDVCCVTITPTYTGCPAMGLLEDQIRLVLADAGIGKVKIKLTYTPAWTTDWINEEAKMKLKTYGIAPPRHSSCSAVYAGNETVACPRCQSGQTLLISQFGSTACKALYACKSCKEPFEYFKCH